VNLPELEKVILSTFQRTLPRQRYPLCFLHLQLPPQWLDWHRHPAKIEIYLQHLSHWQQQIKTILQEQLGLLTAQTMPRINQLLKAAEPTGIYQLQSPSFTDVVLAKEQSLTAIAQVRQTYVVVEHPQGVWLVEQHVAHERILFEQLQKDWQCLPLEQPLLLQKFSPGQIEQLQSFGLEIDPFGEDVWAVRSLPQLLMELDNENLTQILQELSQLDSLTTFQAAIACRRAIKNGTKLERLAMNQLIEQWQKCENPRTCPHGRPIYLTLDDSSLARFFRRNSLFSTNKNQS
jgi:DNA mismatch repair protein MutL